MTRPTLRQMVDEHYPCDVDDQLEQWQAARVSVPAMARMLSAGSGVAVSAQTVRRWLGIAP